MRHTAAVAYTTPFEEFAALLLVATTLLTLFTDSGNKCLACGGKDSL